MAIYRFKVSFENHDDIIREVDMLAKHTFLDLHQLIQQDLGYDSEVSSSFYFSNDQWRKGKEIAYLPSDDKVTDKVILMDGAQLNKHINDPHQKFYYTYNFARPIDFHVQLIKILKEEEGKTYPLVSKSIGLPPKPINQADFADVDVSDLDADEDKPEDFDFLNEMEYTSEDTEDMDFLDDSNLSGADMPPEST